MFHGILDPQPDRLGFAVFNDSEKLFSCEKLMRGRDAAAVPGFITDTLKEYGIELADISRWTLGSGPGSFTFLRVIAALAAGWKYGHSDIKFRCIPGAVALAASIAPESGENVGVLYDGRNSELLYFGIHCDGKVLSPAGETAILDKEKAIDFFRQHAGERFVAFECEKAAISAILPENTALTTASADLSALALDSAVEFDDDLDRLVYIRPAVADNN